MLVRPGRLMVRGSGGGLWVPAGGQLVTDVSWSGTGVNALSVDVATAPDGTTTAEKMTENSAAAVHGFFQGGISMTSGISARIEAYLKASERTHVAVSAVDPSGNRYAALFNLSTGATATTDSVGTPTGTSNGSRSLGNGWFLCFVTITPASTGSGFIQLGLSDSATPTWNNNLPTYTGDGTSGAFVWGARKI